MKTKDTCEGIVTIYIVTSSVPIQLKPAGISSNDRLSKKSVNIDFLDIPDSSKDF